MKIMNKRNALKVLLWSIDLFEPKSFSIQNNFSKVSYKFNLKLELKGIGDRCSVKCLDIAPRKYGLISR